MTLQKTKTIRNLIFISVCVFTIGIILGFTVYSCGIQHIAIMADLKSYEKSLDPEFCDVLVEKINLFDTNCKPEVEILDCG
ncbi:MAG: hypothetical protein Q7R33_10330 [Nitrosarchaeum sp.]|nr:hypothetical protein [Nitrosarchaeum sp.]